MSVTVNNITRSFGAQLALHNVSFSIPEGEIVGFLGPNGAGKSTMMKILTGYLQPDSGEALICGQPVRSDDINIRRLIGYLPEHNPLYPEMYVREYLAMVADMYKLPRKRALVDEMIERTGLAPEAHKQIHALSKGYRQRVGIAQALIHNPQVIILDEPTTGLDPNQIVEIRELIKEVGKEKTVMLSTHIMQEVEAICNRVILIDHGIIRADGNIADILAKTSGREAISIEFNGQVDMQKLRTCLEQFAADNNLSLEALNLAANNMESIFHKLTSEK